MDLADGEQFRFAISDGDAGILETLEVMRAVARDAAHHDTGVRRIAAAIARRAGTRTDRLKALYRYMRHNIQFERDPVDVELVRTPARLLAQIERDGVAHVDCDCISTFAAAVMHAMSIPTSFVVVGRGERYEHVYPAARVAGRLVGLDAQEKVPFGAHPAGVVRRYVFSA